MMNIIELTNNTMDIEKVTKASMDATDVTVTKASMDATDVTVTKVQGHYIVIKKVDQYFFS
jgi:hypothetical protein